ncbi:MAG: O-antigen ligase family protein [Pseudomonadota bacterium]
MQMLNWGLAYRIFAYLNLCVVLIYGLTQFKQHPSFNSHRTLYGLFFIPLTFITMHFLAVENLVIIREIRHIFVALFLTLGIWILAKKNPDYIKNNMLVLLLTLIFSYVVIQAIALWYFKQPHGTTKNPHYLAAYSALSLIAAVFCFFKVSGVLRYLIGLSILCLGAFLLQSSSRPTWIGLIFSGFLLLMFMNKRARIYSAFSIVSVLIGLTLANIGNFATRFGDLLGHLDTEERVVIWQDTWRMQSESSPMQWLLGHGLNAFKADFKPYSYYHLQNIDYNSPHNFLLELLYISGAVGLALAILMLWIIYKYLFAFIRSQTESKNIYLLLLAILTTNLILVSITLPFFTSYNLNIIGLVIGVMLYLKETQLKQA